MQLSSDYSHNFLVQPLVQFHQEFQALCQGQYDKSHELEWIKKIFLAVASPFAYIALGFAALVGLMLDGWLVLPLHEVSSAGNSQEPISLTQLFAQQESMLSGESFFGDSSKTIQQVSRAIEGLYQKNLAPPKQALEQSGQAFLHALIPLRRNENAALLHSFLESLEKDPHILPEIVRELKDKSAKGDLSWLGEDIASGCAFFTQERQPELRERICRQSSWKELEESLKLFQEELLEDVRAGKETIHSNTVSRIFERFFTLQRKAQFQQLTPEERRDWEREWKRIINTAYLRQEISKRENSSKQRMTFFLEKKVLSFLGCQSHPETDEMESRRKQQQAELEVMRLILKGQGLEDYPIEAIQKLLEVEKRKARLQAAGLTEQQVCFAMYLLHLLRQFYADLSIKTKPFEEQVPGLPSDFPPLAMKFLLKERKYSVESARRRATWKIVESQIGANSVDFQTKEGQAIFLQSIKKTLEQKDFQNQVSSEKSYPIREEQQRCIDFYQKWGKYLVQEMIQGFDDEQEVLGSGVCLAIAIRMALNDQRNPKLGGSELGKGQLSKITRSDRFLQALHKVSVKFSKTEPIAFPEAFLKINKIRSVEIIQALEIDQGKTIPEQIQLILQSNEKKFGTNGVALMIFSFAGSGHALYIRLDRKQDCEFKIGRIGDSGVGLLEFTDSTRGEEEFVACLADLIEVFYKKRLQSIYLARLLLE